jgi:hypothetical protein
VRTVALSVVVLVLQIGGTSSSAQDVPGSGGFPRGSYSVRMADGEAIRGRLLSLGPDTIEILVKGRPLQRPFDQVLQVDRHGDPLKNGALIGAAILGVWCAVICGQGLRSGGSCRSRSPSTPASVH